MSDFFIPPAKIPTKEESRLASLKWLEPLEFTLLDRIPQDVMDLSAETKFFKIPLDLMMDAYEGKPSVLDDFVSEVDRKVGWSGHIWKLNSRSPKDAWSYPPITPSAKQAMDWILASERALDDLVRFSHIEDVAPAYLCARKPIRFGKFGFNEFRCFVKNGNLIAISDYDYCDPNKLLRDYHNFENDVVESIHKFFDTLKPRFAHQDYVFDVIISLQYDVKLIEINPYRLSDPCFFRNYEDVENACPRRIKTGEGAQNVR